jgi:hypothetical protein
MRNATDSRLDDTRVVHDGCLDVEGGDVQPASDDEVRVAVHEVEIAVLVYPPDIPGSCPPVIEEHAQTGILAVITALRRVAAQLNVTGHTWRHLASVSTRDPHLRAGGGAAERRRPRAIIIGRHAPRPGLCRRVDITDPRGREQFRELLQGRRVDRRARGADLAHGAKVPGTGGASVDERDRHRRHQHDMGGPVPLHGAQEIAGVKLREGQDTMRARCQRLDQQALAHRGSRRQCVQRRGGFACQ